MNSCGKLPLVRSILMSERNDVNRSEAGPRSWISRSRARGEPGDAMTTLAAAGMTRKDARTDWWCANRIVVWVSAHTNRPGRMPVLSRAWFISFTTLNRQRHKPLAHRRLRSARRSGMARTCRLLLLAACRAIGTNLLALVSPIPRLAGWLPFCPS